MKKRSGTTISCMALVLMAPMKCKKEIISPGQLLQANGYVIDSFKNKRLPGAMIYLYGGTESYGTVNYNSGPLDSAISDASGNFSISYKTEGNSVDYALKIANYSDLNYLPQHIYITDDRRLQAYYPFNGAFTLNNIVLNARELNYLRLNLKVLSNPYDTLSVTVMSADGELSNWYNVPGTHIDTTLFTYYLPGYSSTNFQYEISNHFLSDSATGFFRMAYDTLPPTSQDTVIFSKTFNSAYDMPLRHY